VGCPAARLLKPTEVLLPVLTQALLQVLLFEVSMQYA